MRQLTNDQRRCLDEVIRYGRQSIGYFHLQDGLDYHFRARGFASSVTHRGPSALFGLRPLTYFLGNPVTPDEDLEETLGDLVERHGGRAMFMQIDERAGAILERLGYRVNIVGKDLWLDLDRFRPRGNQFGYLKKIANRHAREGTVVVELPWSEAPRDEVLAISESWRKARAVGGRELSFLMMPPTFDDEPGVRKFYGFTPEGRLRGFVHLLPHYRDGKVGGYTLNVMRDGRDGTWGYIVLRAIERLREEGIERLGLAILPLCGTDEREPFAHSRVLKRCLQAAFHFGERLYNFKGLAQHKRRFRPREELIFAAVPRRRNSIRALLGGFETCGVM